MVAMAMGCFQILEDPAGLLAYSKLLMDAFVVLGRFRIESF